MASRNVGDRIERAAHGLPARLKKVRGDRTQRGWARELGVFQQNINRYESGDARPHFDFLARIALVEKVDLNWLVTGRPQ